MGTWYYVVMLILFVLMMANGAQISYKIDRYFGGSKPRKEKTGKIKMPQKLVKFYKDNGTSIELFIGFISFLALGLMGYILLLRGGISIIHHTTTATALKI